MADWGAVWLTRRDRPDIVRSTDSIVGVAVGVETTGNQMSGRAVNVVQARDISAVHINNTVELPIPRQLPPDVVPFVDRAEALDRLHDWLTTAAAGSPRHTVVVGAGGVGKTAVVTHWAHQVSGRFPDGQLYIDLHGYHSETTLSPEQALHELLCAFVPPDRVPLGLAAMVGLYRSLLQERRMLILLDNAASVDQVRPLLSGAPHSLVVITSRNRLSGLVAREGAQRMPLDVLPPERAVDLLRRMVGASRIDREPAAAAELARWCGHLPLALRIVAERLAGGGDRPLSDVLVELAEEGGRLDALATEDDDSSSVRTVLSWSYHALNPAAARMFRLLSLPTGPDIGVGAAAALAGVSSVQARRLLDTLVGAHLLQESAPRRYQLHDLLRAYSAERVRAEESAGERMAALRRVLAWCVRAAESAVRVLYPHRIRSPLAGVDVVDAPAFTEPRQALEWCDSESRNLTAAVGQAAELGEDEIAWQLPVTLFGYFVVRKPWSDWIGTFETGLVCARRLGNREAEAWLLSGIAVPHFDLGDHDTAVDCLCRALEAWRDTGHRWGEVWTLRDLGRTYRRQGRLPEAVEHLERALAQATTIGDRVGEADTRVYLADAYCGLGRFEEALGCVRVALAIRGGSGDRRDVAGVLDMLSHVHRNLGQFDAAIDSAARALDIWRDTDYPHGQAVASERLGHILADVGRTDEAREHWNTALTIFTELGDPRADELRSRLDG